MNPLLPRVDSRGEGSGITGMEFPLVPYLIACGYRLGGRRDPVARITLLAFSLVGVTGCFLLVRESLGSSVAGLAGSVLLIFSPMFFLYSTAAIPDLPMLGFLCHGLFGLQVWSRTGRPVALVGGLAALMLAALLKLSAMVAAPVALLLFWRGSRSTPVRAWLVVGLVAVAALAVAGWYQYARLLSDAHGHHVFRLEPSLPYPPEIVPDELRRILLRWLPDHYVSWPEFALFVVGLVMLPSQRGRPPASLLLAHALGIAAYLIAFLPAIRIHDYYMFAALPLLILIVTVGFERLRRAAESRRVAAVALGVLATAAAIVGPLRASSYLSVPPSYADLLGLEAHLDRVIRDRRELVVAASDSSPSIYLYFIHRKGWAVTDSVPAGFMAGATVRGARYLVSDSRLLESRPDIAPYLLKRSRHGMFRVFELLPLRR